jgi:hypothetical protein
MLGAIERLDHEGIGGLQADTLAGTDDAVFLLALAGQPDAAGEHRQFAGAVADTARLAREKPLAERVQGRQGVFCSVRIHHQSPEVHGTMIGVNRRAIQ